MWSHSSVSFSGTSIINSRLSLRCSLTSLCFLPGDFCGDVCDGTNTNAYLPIYGYYNDAYQINQMIYPENLLTDLVGKTLTSMTFYATANLGANLGSSVWTIKLGTTTQTVFANNITNVNRLVPSDVVTVAQGYSITSGISTMTINFSTPFTYNGGNLLVDFQSTTKGSFQTTNFFGVNQSSYTGYNSYNSNNATPGNNGHYSNGNGRQFLPKVTFTYDPNATPKTITRSQGSATLEHVSQTYVVNGFQGTTAEPGQTVSIILGKPTNGMVITKIAVTTVNPTTEQIVKGTLDSKYYVPLSSNLTFKMPASDVYVTVIINNP